MFCQASFVIRDDQKLGAHFFVTVLLKLVLFIKIKRERFLFSSQKFSRDNYVFHQRTREDGESPYSHRDQR